MDAVSRVVTPSSSPPPAPSRCSRAGCASGRRPLRPGHWCPGSTRTSRRHADPARHERGDELGVDGGHRLPHADRPVLRAQPHPDDVRQPGDVAAGGLGTGLRGRPARGAGKRFSLKDLHKLPREAGDRLRRVRGQRPQRTSPLRRARRRRARSGGSGRSAWRAGAAFRCARSSNAPACGPTRSTSCPKASTARSRRPTAPTRDTSAAVADRQGAGRHAGGAGDERPRPDVRPRRPARVIVPGWVGIANIKWVGAIVVANRPVLPWNTTQYRLVGPTYPADQPPLTTQPLKSAFEVAPGQQFKAGEPVKLRGRSWSGSSRPRSVRVRSRRRDLDRRAARSARTPRTPGCAGPSTGPRRGPARPRCWPRPPTAPATSSPIRAVQPRRLPVRRHRPGAGHRHGLTPTGG